MDSSKKSNKIREVVRLQQILKKWKKAATVSKTNSTSSKGINFLKRTLSFTDNNVSSNDTVPKGFLAVCVGKDLKRFIIPTHYLRHQAFEMLLQEAEEEFGFQQEGVLKIPCHVSVFEKILKLVQDNNDFSGDKDNISCEVTPPHHAQMWDLKSTVMVTTKLLSHTFHLKGEIWHGQEAYRNDKPSKVRPNINKNESFGNLINALFAVLVRQQYWLVSVSSFRTSFTLRVIMVSTTRGTYDWVKDEVLLISSSLQSKESVAQL
ncbi:hypothetical protein RJT34_16878 [Clitoria ternatea]|uniref:Uncharacterized protein n=1 Tax=Clitoria ternatea TaxID=43366 RepID=A0AAN9J7Y1_CLITE